MKKKAAPKQDYSKTKALAIGKLLVAGNRYISAYKIGGSQRLQALIGKMLFEVKKNGAVWHTGNIKKLTPSQINAIANKVDVAFKKKSK